MSSKNLSITGVLIILVGAFMLLSGIAALNGNTQGLGNLTHNISRAFGGSGNTFNIIIAIIEIVAGALLILSRFVSIGIPGSLLRIALFIFWVVLMVLSLVTGNNIEKINTLDWWISLVNQSIILVILWTMKD